MFIIWRSFKNYSAFMMKELKWKNNSIQKRKNNLPHAS